MGSSFYRYGQWGYLEVDPSDGSTVRSLGPADRLYIPGSSTKLFSVSATLDELGFDHGFKTPVYAQGKLENGKLDGDLVLVASGTLPWVGEPRPTGPYPRPTSTTPTPTACRGRRSLPSTRSLA